MNMWGQPPSAVRWVANPAASSTEIEVIERSSTGQPRAAAPHEFLWLFTSPHLLKKNSSRWTN